MNRYLLIVMIYNLANLNFTFGANTMETDEMKKAKIYKMINEFPNKLKNAPTMTSKEAFETAKDTEVIYVDVRKNKEMKVSMIKNAISKEEFENNISAYKNSTIIPYCTIGYRSAKYTLEIAKKGYKAFNLEGGVLLWAFAGYNVFDKSGNIIFDVHVYGSDWNLLPKKFTGIW